MANLPWTKYAVEGSIVGIFITISYPGFAATLTDTGVVSVFGLSQAAGFITGIMLSMLAVVIIRNNNTGDDNGE